MKKSVSSFMIAAMITLFLSGCALHQGSMQNSASLSAANFSYVKQQIQGEASAAYILGIGGLDRATLVDDAKQNMMKSNPLSSNQALANITVNFKSTYLIIYVTVECIVTADVVEFK